MISVQPVHTGLQHPANSKSLKGLTEILKSLNQVNQGSDSVCACTLSEP